MQFGQVFANLFINNHLSIYQQANCMVTCGIQEK